MGGNEAMSSVGGIFIPFAARPGFQKWELDPVSPSKQERPRAVHPTRRAAPSGPMPAKKFSESRLVLRIELRFALHPRFCVSSFPSSHVLF